jgi:hypothetical protein
MPEHDHAHEHGHAHSLDECIDACTACYLTCMAALHQSLRTGGEHAAAPHVRLLMACAEICRACAHVMMTGYPGHGVVCAACAQVCDECAEACARLEGLEDCVVACRDCAHVCRSMA